jgi:hypothetical protein
MEAVRTSETSVDNYFTRQYIPEDNSEQVILRQMLNDNFYKFVIFFNKLSSSDWENLRKTCQDIRSP